MSFFNTTASLHHTSPLPAGTDKAHAVRLLLHNHRFFVQCGPHSVDCVRVDGDEAARLAAQALDEDASQEHPLPEAVRSRIAASLAVAGGPASEEETEGFAVYRVTDVVHTLPAGLWDSRVVSTYEMTNTPTGVFVRVRSPMSIVMDTVWTVGERGGDEGEEEVQPGALQLTEDICIYCSRLLMGTVRGLCDAGWLDIHAKMAEQLARVAQEAQEVR